MGDPKKEGILLVDKEKGRTAFYYVKVLRKLSGIRKRKKKKERKGKKKKK